MGFEGRKKEKYIGAEKFIEKMKEIQEEVKAVCHDLAKRLSQYLYFFFFFFSLDYY